MFNFMCAKIKSGQIVRFINNADIVHGVCLDLTNQTEVVPL
jgi:hypothetical protein